MMILNFRNQWQMNIKNIKIDENKENKSISITYLINSKIIEETFIQTIYKENDNIYVVGNNLIYFLIKFTKNIKISKSYAFS